MHLLANPKIKLGAGVGKVFEFSGSATWQLSTDERATLTNMTAELGGSTHIVAPDQETAQLLRHVAPFTPCAFPGELAGKPVRLRQHKPVVCEILPSPTAKWPRPRLASQTETALAHADSVCAFHTFDL